MKIASKFSYTQIYLQYAFLIAILILAVYLVTRPDITLHTSFGSTMSAAYTGLMFIVISLLYFYYNQKYVLKIYVSENILIIASLFKHQTYSVSDIQNIDLFARKSLGLLTYQRKSNGISINTSSNQSYFLADIYYRNAPEVKEAIYNNFKPVVCNQTGYENAADKDSFNKLTDSDFEKFSGNYIVSYNGITVIAFFILPLVLFQREGIGFLLFLTLLNLLYLSIPFASQEHYFLLSKDPLIVKNQLWWWRNIGFDLNNVKGIIIESYYGGSNSLRVNTKDFRSKLFQAGSLRDKTWQKLNDRLKETGIEVQNET